MKDQRLAHYRAAFESLVESLSAVARICRWEGPDSAPEALQQTAARVLDRLATANRLTGCHLVGRPDVIAVLSRICSAIQKLDKAYVEYRHSVTGTPQECARAAADLDFEIGDAQTQARGV
jgi:hypothetical protein